MNKKPLIAVIGDSNIPENSLKYELAEKLGFALITEGYRIITGGLGGVMEAVSKGGTESPKHQDGDIIGLIPGCDPLDANKYVDICIATGLDISRNIIISNSDAVIAIGGGAGTITEIGHAWALKRLVIAYKVEGWSGKVADQRIDERIRYSEIPGDRVYGVSSEVEAIELLKLLDRYDKRHSFVKRRKN